MHPLHTFGYKNVLVLVGSLQNYEEDLHACIFESTQRETEGESCFYFSRAGQKDLVEKRNLKKSRGGEKLKFCKFLLFSNKGFYR